MISEKISTLKFRSRTRTESYLGAFNLSRLWGRPATFTAFSLDNFIHHKMLENFPDFADAGARLEASLKCWSLQQNTGDLATMEESQTFGCKRWP